MLSESDYDKPVDNVDSEMDVILAAQITASPFSVFP